MPHARTTAILLLATLAGVLSAQQAPEFRDNRPTGPDDIFIPLPAQGLHQGTAPQKFRKAVILHAPFADSWNDLPLEDLPPGARAAALAAVMMLEQRLDYLPNVYRYLPQMEAAAFDRRVMRYQARLRFAELPRPDCEAILGASIPVLDQAANRFGARDVFVFTYSRASEDHPARAKVLRYDSVAGLQGAREIVLGAPDGNRLSEELETAIQTLCAGIATVRDREGNEKPLPHAPVPRLAANDTDLMQLVRMRQSLENGEIMDAWVRFEELRKRKAVTGAAARLGVEAFRALGEQPESDAMRADYMGHLIRAAAEGLTVAPNDVMLRAKVCRYISIWYRRDEWALKGLRDALTVQPADAHVLDWHAAIGHNLDNAAQAAWLEEHALPLLPDGRGAFLVATAHFMGQRHAQAVTFYRSAIKSNPHEHEYQFSLGLAATYLSEQLDKLAVPGPDGDEAREQALDAAATASEALLTAQRLDPTELGWPYEYQVRVATRNFRRLPVNPSALKAVMRSQAVVNGLTSTSATAAWDRVVAPVIATQRRLLVEIAAEATPKHPEYELWLMVRLQLARVDGRVDDTLDTLATMRRWGHRSALYAAAMQTHGPALDQREAKTAGK